MDSKETIDHDPVEEPYFAVESDLVCSYCAKKYKRLGDMKKHLMKNHDVEQPIMFLCEKCKKSFDTQKQLSRHNKMKGDCSSKWC